MSKRFLVPLTLAGGSTLPSGGNLGDLFFKTDENAVYVFTSTGWAELAGGVSGLTANRALASDASGNVVSTAVTDTELGHVVGVTSAIQTQINNKLSLNGGTLNNGVNTAIEIVGSSNAFIDFKNLVSDDFDARLINTNGYNGLIIAAAPAMTSDRTLRNITVSTSAPSGGVDGDVWLQYTA